MLGERYVVAAGDSLWAISARHLGGGAQWPRLWRYNNRPEVMRVTGRGIVDPDLIFAGQTLLIPKSPGMPPARDGAPQAPAPSGAALARPAGTTSAGGPLGRQLPTLASPVSYKYRLDDIKVPPVPTPTAIIEYRMAGDVLFMSRQSYPALYVTSRKEIEAQVTREMNHAFGKLATDNRFIFNQADRSVTLRSMLVSQSDTPHAPSTAIGVETSSNSPVPKLRAEIRFPKLSGSIDRFLFVAVDVKFIIEITPRLDAQGSPSPQPLRLVQAAPGVDWSKVIGTGLVVTAGAIVVATVIEDFLTAGAGLADDPASFAAAGVAFTRGLAMIRGAAALPHASSAASVTFGTAVQLAH